MNQSSAGVDKVNALINCHLLTGRIGRPGMGPFSITGQPNAMGGREVGALSNTLAAHMDFAPADIDRVGRFWRRRRAWPRKPGLKAVELFEAVRARPRSRRCGSWRPIRSPACPTPTRCARRSQACELSIVSEAMRASDTVDACRIRLPALAWAEKDGTVTNSERGISRQRPFLPPPGEARQDWWIIAEVARRLGLARPSPGRASPTSSASMPALSAFENDGTRDFDIGAYADIDDGGYEIAGALRLAGAQGRASGEPLLRRGRLLPSRPARPLHRHGARASPSTRPAATGRSRLNTGRVRDQWHTMTRTGKSPRLAGHRPEPTIELQRHRCRAARICRTATSPK